MTFDSNLSRFSLDRPASPSAEPSAPTTSAQPFIVAEISKNYYADGRSLQPFALSQLFEEVIDVNHRRGYRLLSFQLHRLMTRPNELNETIIAVFERDRLVAEGPG